MNTQAPQFGQRRRLRRLPGTAPSSRPGVSVSKQAGEEFPERLHDHRPDSAVLDLHMPEVDVFKVPSRLAKAGVRIPVIVVTGRDTPEA